MSEYSIKEQKEKLLKEKKDLEKTLSILAKKSDKDGKNWQSKYPKFGEYTTLEDDADKVEEYANLLPVEKRLEAKLIDIKRALEKINKEKGYGICEKCQKKIKKDRMEAMPEAKFCSKCI